MILPCRIHGARKRNRVDSLPLALVLVACLFCPVREATSQNAVAAASEAAGFGWLPAVPIQITAGVDIGYDDHVTGNNGTANSSGQKLSIHERKPGPHLCAPHRADTTQFDWGRTFFPVFGSGHGR